MNNILQKQFDLNHLIAVRHGDTVLTTIDQPSKLDTAKFIQEHLAHLQFEIHELLEEVGDGSMSIVKPWSTKQAAFAEQGFEPNDKIKSEAIDALCFCLNIILAVGITPDNIEDEFYKVWHKNMRRQLEGY